MDKLWHGVYSVAELITRGVTRQQIRALVRQGSLARVRHGWYCTPEHDAKVLTAVQVGGAVSCVTALAMAGVWHPDGFRRIHIRRAWAKSGGPKAAGCYPYGEKPPVKTAVDPLDVALRCAARCVDGETFIVLLDSIMHNRLATRTQLESALVKAPERVRALLNMTDAAEAGTESICRIRLRRRGITVRTQVWITARRRVDLVIGDRLIIECDSRAHHSSWEQQEGDRE